jgi:hypothetical protein
MVRVLVGTFVLALLLAACGGSGSGGEASEEPAAAPTEEPEAATTEEPETGGSAVVETVETIETSTEPVTPGSIEALLEETPGEDVALVFGTGDYAVGENRISFLIVNEAGELVEQPEARVRVAAGGLEGVPEVELTADLLPVGAPPAESDDDDFDAPNVYVFRLAFVDPGLYTLLVELDGVDIQAVGHLEVAAEPSALAVGDKAFPSDNPTVADAFPQDITTADPPDVEMLQYSVKESLEAGVPFVVTFSTPKFCETRVCGPVLDIVDAVRKQTEGTGIRFIHIEIFEDNDPQRGFNKWVREWNLPSEPYTFLVDETGTIVERFEGLVTAVELEQAVRDYLL